MDFPQLVTLYFERSVALQNYWTLYVVIIGGLLAFSSMRARPNRLTTVLITVLFLCFAYKNCGAILDVSKQRIAVLGDVRTASMHQEALYADGRAQSFVGRSVLPSMEDVPTPESSRRFHYSCDVLTVLTLWSMEWRRRKHEREEREKDRG